MVKPHSVPEGTLAVSLKEFKAYGCITCGASREHGQDIYVMTSTVRWKCRACGTVCDIVDQRYASSSRIKTKNGQYPKMVTHPRKPKTEKK